MRRITRARTEKETENTHKRGRGKTIKPEPHAGREGKRGNASARREMYTDIAPTCALVCWRICRT
eukprot:2670233-Lingulodinium_polyedra.AAC.1